MQVSPYIINNAWLKDRGNLVQFAAMPSKQEIEDEDIRTMREAAAGNENAFAVIIRKWQKPLINFFYRSTQSVELAEDLAQMTFIKLYRSAERYEPTAKFSTFLFHIGRHLLINEIRRQNRKPQEATDPAAFTQTPDGQNEYTYFEIEEAFMRALQTLPEKQKTAILLLKQQALSYEEIAQTMDASAAAVKSWIHRARQKLKEELQDFYAHTP